MATLVTVSAVQPMAVGRSPNSRDFVVVCPDHPHVTLMKRKPGLFSRTKVIHQHCPLCQQQQQHHDWSNNAASSYQNNYDHFGGLAPPSHDHSHANENHFSSTSWEPSAPFDDTTVNASDPSHFSTPTIEEGDEDGSVSASVIAMIESLERTSLHPHESSQQPSSSVGSSQQNGITENITALVHSLLEGHRKGPDFILNQLEMLAAWSTAEDSEIRQAITDAGGIYIVINVLQRCLERLNGTEVGSRTGSVREHNENSSHFQPRDAYLNDFGGDTTIATHTLDDGTIATHMEEPDDLDSLPTAFATAVPSPDRNEHVWTHNGAPPSPVAHDSTTSSYAQYTTSSNYSTAGGSTITGDSSVRASSSFVASQPPTWDAIDQAFSSSKSMQQQQRPQQNPSDTSVTSASFIASQPPTLNSLGRTNFVTATAASAPAPNAVSPYQETQGSMKGDEGHPRSSQVSPAPAPTMDDIERAFGHFLHNPSSDNITVGGDNTTFATPHSQHPAVPSSASRQSGMNTASISGYSMPSSYRVQSTSHSHGTPLSVSGNGPASVASSSFAPRYVPPEALDGVMSMAAMKTIDSDTIRKEVRLAIATLDNLVQDGSNVDIFRTAGGIEAVLSAMWRFEHDEMVQEHGCECLYSLVSLKKENHHLKSMIMSLGGIATVMRSMTLFPSSPRILETCCLFLGSMAVHDPVSQQSILTLKGPQAILGSMRLHRLDEKLQEAACETLESMMRQDNQVYMDIVFNRGVEAFLTAMWQFEQNGNVQRAASASLGLVCKDDDGNKRIVLEYGGVESILRAMRLHRQNVYVQRAGIIALTEIADNHVEALGRCLAEENALELLRQAAGEVEHEACKKFLRNLRLHKYRSRVF